MGNLVADNEMVKSNGGSGRSSARRFAPALAFIATLCLLVVFCYDRGYSGLPPTEKRYVAAKTAAATLLRDAKKNGQREPWEKLAAEFRSIYETDPAWPNRPAALLRAGEALEELAKRSCSRADAKKAIACYEALALKHASSRLADDALFKAARMRATQLKDEKGALSLLARLKKQYPKGDMIREAEALEKALVASANGKTAPAAVRELNAGAPVTVEPAETPRPQKSDFAGDLPLRYKAALSRMKALRADSTRACWRQPWEELRDEFLRIAKNGKNRLAPSAYFQAAACSEAIAKCSRLTADRKKAIESYFEVQGKFPNHALGAEALLAAARLQRDLPGGQQKCAATLDTLLKKYPKSTVAADAKRLKSLVGDTAETLAAIKPPKVSRASPVSKPELQVLSWDSPDKNSVRIALEMSAPAKFTSRLTPAKKGRPASVFVDLQNADVVNDIRKGVAVQGSLLKAVRVTEQKNGGATLQFDFRDVRKYETRVETNPHRIIITAAAGKTAPPPADASTAQAASAPRKKAVNQAIATRVSDMASQLGLTVQRVFIDAGHGGRDPGTSHNKIVEKAVTLDVALAVGRLLKANGLEVVYGRTRDATTPLSERTRMANAAGADLFVSIHVNANDNPAASGIETYFLDLASTPQAARVAMMENSSSDRRLGDMQNLLADVMLNARAGESRRLASDIQRLTQFRLKKRSFSARDNGVKSAPFHVLVGAKMPAVLVEIGYCTNPAEAKNLASPGYRNALAEGLAEGILAYRDRLLRNRTAGAGLTKQRKGAI